MNGVRDNPVCAVKILGSRRFQFPSPKIEGHPGFVLGIVSGAPIPAKDVAFVFLAMIKVGKLISRGLFTEIYHEFIILGSGNDIREYSDADLIIPIGWISFDYGRKRKNK